MKNLYIALLMIAVVGLAFADQHGGDADLPIHEVFRATGDIKVDGKLDETDWSAAQGIILQFPWESLTGAKQKTVVKLLWDDNNLYVGYDCEDEELTAIHDTRDDPTYEDDCVEIFISPDEGKIDLYYGLEMNCRAVLYDYFYVCRRSLIKRFDMRGVELETDMRGTLNASGDKDEGWSLEVAIPFENFSDMIKDVPPKPGSSWRINLNRLDGVALHRQLSMWSPSGTEKPNFHVPERFGKLVFSEQTP